MQWAARAPTGLNIIAFMVLLVSGALVIYSLWIMLISLTFWFTKFDNNVTLMQALMDTGRYPAAVYPGWPPLIVTFIVPITLATTVPMQAFAVSWCGGRSRSHCLPA